ncbi:MAG: zinc ribbon domain-containing protein [Phycisphaerae bacterium]|nr:zinc ribbon domain-containing protein [Phycisphaerae bacterium]
MPTYDYTCSSCEHAWELFQSITAKPIRKCPQCGRQTARRMIGTGAGILFKGSGFYCTDYRSEGYEKAAKSESDSSAGKSKGESGGSGAKATTESKSTPTPESKPSKKPDDK